MSKVIEREHRRLAQALALFRVLVGAYFIYQGYSKLDDPMFSAYLPSMLKNWAQGNPVFFYQDVMTYVLVPQAKVVSVIVIALELLVGVALALGAYMRWTLMLMAFLLANYLMATAHADVNLLALNVLFLCSTLVFFWGEAGRHYGLDRFLLARTGSATRTTRSKKKPANRRSSAEKPAVKRKKVALPVLPDKLTGKPPSRLKKLVEFQSKASLENEEDYLDDDDDDDYGYEPTVRRERDIFDDFGEEDDEEALLELPKRRSKSKRRAK